MIEPALRTAVATLTTIPVGLVNVPESTTPPYVRMFRVSGPRGSNHSGPNGLVISRFQVDVVSETYQEAKIEAEKIYSLQTSTVTDVAKIVLENERDNYENDSKLFFVSLDFMVHHYKEV